MENCVEITHTQTHTHTYSERKKAVRNIYQQQCTAVAHKFECWHEGSLYAQVNKWFFDGFKHIPARIPLSVPAICVCFILISWCTVVKIFSFSTWWQCTCAVCCVRASVSRLHYDTATQLIH